MADVQEKCDCKKPDINIDETCGGCGNLVNFEHLRQRAIDTYDRNGQPIENSNLPRRHLRMENPSNSLRLLHLDDRTSPILSGTFERVSITHLPPYEAVSYCWGGEDGDYTKPEFIIIGGRLFPITKNCAAVLRQIRKPNGKRVIWVDSLCINQNDVKERSVQVSQMGKIFSGAQKVHIYLGSNVDDRTAIKAFHVLRSMGDLAKFNKGLQDTDIVEAVKTLFTQTYFSRMWIIQEVLLAKSVELHWGTVSIPWQTLSEGHLDALRRYDIHSQIPEWMRIRAMSDNFRNPGTLGELLFSTMGSTASNDRDKVYGIYGLLFDAKEEGLTVDYGLSVKQVFRNMALHLITKHNAFLAVLRHATHDSPLIDGEQLPSWVPDFRSRYVPRDVSISFDGSSELNIRSSISSEDVISGFGENELYLRGHRLRIFTDRRKSFTEYSKVVLGKIGGQETKWEVRAKIPVDFDPDDHVIFWMPNGLLLQLKRHLTREDTYQLLGECTLKHSGSFPTLVVHNRPTSFADAMFGLELQDLTSLWKLYTNFRSIIPYNAQFEFPDTGMGTEESNRVIRAYRSFCTLEDSRRHSLESYIGQRDDLRRTRYKRWVLRFDGEGRFKLELAERVYGYQTSSKTENDTQQAKIARMFDFEGFCESQSMWKTLHSLKPALQCPESYDIREINKLCESWLQHYDLMKKYFPDPPRQISRTEALEELGSWETTTEELSQALRWTEGFFWPFEDLPAIGSRRIVFERPMVNNGNEDGQVEVKPLVRKRALLSEPLARMLVWPEGKAKLKKAEDEEAKDSTLNNQRMPDWVFKNNFERLRHELGRRGSLHDSWRRFDRWCSTWADAIRRLASFFILKDQLNLEDCFRLEERCISRGIWKNEKMEIGQAETIALL